MYPGTHTHSLQPPVIAATTKLVLQSRQIALVLHPHLPLSLCPSGTCCIWSLVELHFTQVAQTVARGLHPELSWPALSCPGLGLGQGLWGRCELGEKKKSRRVRCKQMTTWQVQDIAVPSYTPSHTFLSSCCWCCCSSSDSPSGWPLLITANEAAT